MIDTGREKTGLKLFDWVQNYKNWLVKLTLQRSHLKVEAKGLIFSFIKN